MEGISHFRDIVNHPAIQCRLMRDKTRWLELCVSMDVIRDTFFGFQAYKSFAETKDKGTIYLVIYGVLQCSFVQQDALQALCAAVSYPFKVRDEPRLAKFRELRNLAIGHPVNAEKTDPQFPHNFMVQLTMTPGSFKLHSHGEGGTRFTQVELAELVTQQETVVQEVLRKVAIAMEEKEIEHRRKFRSEKLIEILRQADYAMQKVFEAAWNPEYFEFGAVMLPMIREKTDAFVAALKQRDIDVHAYHGIEDAIKKLNYPLERLAATFARREMNDPELVEIFADYIARKLEQLEEGARIIDKEYESDTLEEEA